MWIAIQRKITKILKRFLTPVLANCLVSDIAPHDLGDFDIEKMRSVQGLTGGKDAPIDPLPGGRL